MITSQNAECPCGSGKQYKRCHGQKDKGANGKSLTLFESLVSTYDALSIVHMLAILQLQPTNHGQNVNLEGMARLALQKKQKKKLPNAPWRLFRNAVSEFEEHSYLQDEPTNAFTDNAIFTLGNYVVYPGINVSGTSILNQLLESIFIDGNNLPAEFCKMVNSASGILLFMSTKVAESMGHKRYMYEEPSDNIFIPEHEQFVEQNEAIVFSKEYLRGFCERIGYDISAINDFIIRAGDSSLKDDDPDNNGVLLRPLIDQGKYLIFYMPTVAVHALIDFIYRKAKHYGCFGELLELLYANQLREVYASVQRMRWFPNKISLPPSQLPIIERTCVFDQNKIAYVCYVKSGSFEDINPDLLSKRADEIVAYLATFFPKDQFNILILHVLAETGHDASFSWGKAGVGNQSLMLQFQELVSISLSEDTDFLTLWKFAKAYSFASEKSRLQSMGGVLDAFAIYQNNNGSLLDSDRAMPDSIYFAVGSSNNFAREVQLKTDEHAIPILINGMLASIKTISFRDYAPIYVLKNASNEVRLAIESYHTPIWVTNYQSKLSHSSWPQVLCEAVAFWLHKMQPALSDAMNALSLVQLEIEIVIDEAMLSNENDVEDASDAAVAVINIQIIPGKIKLHVPKTYFKLARLPDNEADKMLMRATLNGIIQYVEASKNVIGLSADRIPIIVDAIMQPSQAKMILYGDASRNVQLDTRGLPPIRYLQEADVSFLLDSIVSILPPGYYIPELIEDKEAKNKLCNDIVTALLDVLADQIKNFDGILLLQRLIAANERCVHSKEFREIMVPARIACFSDFQKEVDRMIDDNDKLVHAAYAQRTLIEFVATKIPTGTKLSSQDEVDTLLAITDQVVSWGMKSDSLNFGMDDSNMGLLPSGRIGTNKDIEKHSLDSFRQARIESDVFGYVYNFESQYASASDEEESNASSEVEIQKLDMAFYEEYGITLKDLSHIVGAMISKAFNQGKAYFAIEESELINFLVDRIPNLTKETSTLALSLMTLLERESIKSPPAGFKRDEIYPWRYMRQLSYLRRPLIRYIEDGKPYYMYGYRHLQVYVDNLIFLLFEGKLPKAKSPAMKGWLAAILAKKGKPFRNSVKEWLQENSKLRVIDHEVKIEPAGQIKAEKNYGDIDVMAIDDENRIIYSIECKNSVGARNIYEIKGEIDMYLGRKGGEEDAKIQKHVDRHNWLSANMDKLDAFVPGTASYEIVSIILTSQEMPLRHFAKERIALPIISFNKLKKEGVSVLNFSKVASEMR